MQDKTTFMGPLSSGPMRAPCTALGKRMLASAIWRNASNLICEHSKLLTVCVRGRGAVLVCDPALRLQGIMIRLFLFQILNTLGACLIMWGNDWDNWYAQVPTKY